MHYEEMLTWLLFYTSLFEASKTPSQAVIDPGGVVQVQMTTMLNRQQVAGRYGCHKAGSNARLILP